MITWNNNTLKVTAAFIPKFLWSTASIDVSINGRRVLATGGPLKRTGVCLANFCEDRNIHKIRLEWGKADWRWFPYRLFIDDAVVAESKVYITNWPLLAVPYTAFVVATTVLQHFLLFHRL
ncbi:MAG: hypothetical protein WAO98_08590 [Alphaproteobacteria bacterium]